MRQKAELLTATAAGDDFRSGDFAVGEAEVEVALLARAAEEAAVMSAAHRMPSLGAGLGAAVVLSACGAALLAAMTPLLGLATALRAVIALLGFAYVLYVVGRSGERVGRVTTIVCWIVVASAAWLAGLPLAGYVLVHLGLVWLVRSLYYYSGLLPALADLGCHGCSAPRSPSGRRSARSSAWLALWCFFLVQAFHVLIPAVADAARRRRSPRRRTTRSPARTARPRRPCGACPRRLADPFTLIQRSLNMKTNILVTGLVLATVGAVLIYPTIRSNAAGTRDDGRHRTGHRQTRRGRVRSRHDGQHGRAHRRGARKRSGRSRARSRKRSKRPRSRWASSPTAIAATRTSRRSST